MALWLVLYLVDATLLTSFLSVSVQAVVLLVLVIMYLGLGSISKQLVILTKRGF